MKLSDRFVKAAIDFSEKYRISTEILRLSSMISVKLYFGVDILEGARKNDLLRLLQTADELTCIPRPPNMPQWCEIVVTINYYTHLLLRNGRQLRHFGKSGAEDTDINN